MNARDLVISSTVELNAPLTAEFTAGRNIVSELLSLASFLSRNVTQC